MTEYTFYKIDNNIKYYLCHYGLNYNRLVNETILFEIQLRSYIDFNNFTPSPYKLVINNGIYCEVIYISSEYDLKIILKNFNWQYSNGLISRYNLLDELNQKELKEFEDTFSDESIYFCKALNNITYYLADFTYDKEFVDIINDFTSDPNRIELEETNTFIIINDGNSTKKIFLNSFAEMTYIYNSISNCIYNDFEEFLGLFETEYHILPDKLSLNDDILFDDLILES